MRLHSWSHFRKAILLAVLCTALSLASALAGPARGSSQQRDLPPQSEIGLEIRLSGELRPLTRFAGPRDGVGSTVIPRRLLRINDPQAAGDLTALHIEAEVEGDVMKVSLSIIYGDLSNPELWKDKKEKFAVSYLIRAGESVRPLELEQFGIEPVEMKAIDARPVLLKPGEGPRISETSSLKVERLEKHLDVYRVWLKNKSDKNIVAYTISAGGGSIQTGSGGRGGNSPVLASSATSQELHLDGSAVERSGIEILFVMFDDGSFEGDSKSATQFLAVSEGVRVQSPSVLRMIEETLKVDDSDLRAAFDKLEAELWVIPEALYKQPALEFLKAKFPDQDEKSLSALYEVFKGGLYDARNIALASLGETGRTVRGLEERGQFVTAVESIRRTLEHLRETFRKITSAQR